MPSRRNGEYVPLDVRYDEDPDLVEASPLAELLFVRCLALAGRSPSDGYLTDSQVITVAGRKLGSTARVKKLLEELIDLGPLVREGDGVHIRAWLKWNKSSEDLGRERARDRDRKRAERAGDDDGDDPCPPPVRPDSARNPDGQPLESGRSPNGVQPRADARVPPRADARTADGTALNGTTTSADGDKTSDLACVDAREHTLAGGIVVAYAAGVPLADHGRALRTIGQALDAGYEPELVRRGVGVLIAEQRTCTPDALRIAMHTSDPPKGHEGHRRTATEKASQWLTVGLDDEPPPLRALPGGLA